LPQERDEQVYPQVGHSVGDLHKSIQNGTLCVVLRFILGLRIAEDLDGLDATTSELAA
jgi:hypothetical protein